MRKILVLVGFVVLAKASLADKCHHCGLVNVNTSDKFCLSCGANLDRVFDFGFSHSSKRLPESRSDSATPVKISVFSNLAIPADDQGVVYCLDVSALQSKNYSVYGLGVASLAGFSREAAGCFCVGGILSSESFTGLIISGLASESGAARGLAVAGLGNAADSLCGVQIGAVNRAEKMRGVQIGLYNKAGRDVCGVQIGLLNTIRKHGDFLMPLINVGF